MMLDINYEINVVTTLAKEWETAQQGIPQNACILAGRVTSETLTYFNIDHALVPIAAVVENDAMREVHRTGRMTDEAWNVCCGEFSNLDQKDTEASWIGHLIVLTNELFIDLTAPQFSRPAKNINVPSPIIMPLDEMRTHNIPTYDASTIWTGFDLPSGSGRYLFQPQMWNTRYKTGRDWKSGYKSMAGAMIRNVRDTLSHL